jgi:hypothetical protein
LTRLNGWGDYVIRKKTALALAAMMAIAVMPFAIPPSSAGTQVPDEVVPPEFAPGSGLREAAGLPPTASVQELRSAVADYESVHEMIPQVLAFGREHSPVFGGVYSEHIDGRTFLHVLFTHEGARQAEQVRAEVARPERVVIEFAQYSLRELEDLQQQITDDYLELVSDGVDFVSVGVDEALNRVVVGIDEPDDRDRQILADRYGLDRLSIENSSSMHFAASATNDAPPMKGALKIAGFNYECSSGFMISKDGSSDTDVGFYTAGHCVFYGGNDWTHAGHTFKSSGFAQVSGNIDGAAIDIQSSYDQTTWKSHLFRLSDTYYRRVTSRQQKDSDAVGDFVCMAGFETAATEFGRANRCGTLTNRNLSQVCDQTLLTAQRKVDRGMRQGDSGGPVYWPGSDVSSTVGEAQANGLISCTTVPFDEYGDTTYSHVQWIDWQSGWHVRIWP